MDIDITAPYDDRPRFATLEELFYLLTDSAPVGVPQRQTSARRDPVAAGREVAQTIEAHSAHAGAQAHRLNCIAEALNLPPRQYQRWNGWYNVTSEQSHDTRPVLAALNRYRGGAYPGDAAFIAAIKEDRHG